MDKKGSKTYPTEDPKEEIDYFFTNYKPIKIIKHHRIEETIASDHFPIIAEIEVNT